MKVKISIHTFLVQVSKLNCFWPSLVFDIDPYVWSVEFLKNIFKQIEGIVERLPGIDEVDYTRFGDYRRNGLGVFDSPISDFEMYIKFSSSGAPKEVVDITLQNILKVVPDGELLLELDDLEFKLFDFLLKNHIKDPSVLQIHRDPKYNFFTVVEE